MTRPTKSTTRRAEQMCFALAATAFMVFAHPDDLTNVVGPPARNLPAAIDEMATTVAVPWCPAILDDPEMVGWRISRAQWLALASKWCLKPVVVRDRARERGYDFNQRQAGRGHRRRGLGQEHL